jgi:Esterase-like activity of phytase
MRKFRLPAAAAVVFLAAAASVGLTGAADARPDLTSSTSQLSMSLYRQDVPPIGTIAGAVVRGDGFGSAVTPVPGHPNEVYGLTDRGPNVDGPNGTKIEPYPDFQPAIGKFRLRNGRAELIKAIPLQAKDGTPYNGQLNSVANTGETLTDLAGNPLPSSPNGYDPEGLVALRDGSFWVSDEYGPFITHFNRHGRQIARFSPYDGTLPRELALRTPNKGMEGLTITPDGRTLVGIMQSALTQSDLPAKPAKIALTRIVTVNLHSGTTHTYAYVLDDPAETGTGISEIAALSATKFVVDERDGKFGPNAYKKLWKIDLSRATDIGPGASIGAYDAATGGLRIAGKTVEAVAGSGTQQEASVALEAAGITPVTKALYLDLSALVSAVDPDGTFFAHDKVEGLAILRGGRRLIISNDSDFGIAGSTGDAPPFGLVTKTLPDGRQDFGEFLVIDRK